MRISAGVMKHFLLIIVEVALVRYASPPIFCRRKKRGAILAAAATPTMKGDSVMLRISHPTATVSMPVPRENSRVEAHRSLKSR